MSSIKIEGKYITNGKNEILINGIKLTHHDSLMVRNLSPSGFNWGYAGSGPSQLALAICLIVLPKKLALKNYQKFKEKYLVPLVLAEDFELNLQIEDILNLEINT